MSYRRITISVPEAKKAQRAAESGEVESVSAYFADLPAREPDWVEARSALDELLSKGKRLTPADRAWARQALGLADRPKRGAA